MSWEFIKSTDFCDSVRDGTHDTPRQTENGYKLVTGKHIKDGTISYETAYYISEADYRKINERSLVEKWDVLMSMIGTVGEVAVVSSVPDYAIKNIALFKCGGSELKAKWLAYYLKSPIAKGHMTLKGTSQQFLSLTQLRNLPILVTDEPIMQKIVDILSAYDDLIEVNRKQIKLLEEAAERLYREWFIDLRFPGHETATFNADGLPEGWKKGVIADLGEFRRGKTITKENAIEGSVPVVAGGLQPAYYHNKANTNAPVITVSASGANAGYAALYTEKIWASDCSWLDIDNSKYIGFVFSTLLEKRDTLRNMQKGSAQPHVHAKDVNGISIVIPDDNVLGEYEKFMQDIICKIAALRNQISQAAEARDLLLPKLMNGEIQL